MHRREKSSEGKRCNHVLKYLRIKNYVQEFCHQSLQHFPIDSNGDAKLCNENTILGTIPSLGTQYTAQSSFKLRHQITKMFLIGKRERKTSKFPKGQGIITAQTRKGTYTEIMSIIHQYRVPDQPGPHLPAAFHSWILNSNK